MDSSTLGYSVLYYLPEFAQIHVHWVDDAIQPSHPLPPSSPFAFNLSQHQGLWKTVESVQFYQSAVSLQKEKKKNCPRVFALQSDSHLLRALIFLRGIRELTGTLCCLHHLWIHTNRDEYEWEGARVLNGSLQTHSSAPDIWQAGLQGDLQGTVGSRWWRRLAPLGAGVSELVFPTETMPAPVSHHRCHIGATRMSFR